MKHIPRPAVIDFGEITPQGGIAMANRNQPPAPILPHLLTLDERKALRVSGVTEVESFDEQSAVLHTACGTLLITGEGLHLQNLSIDGGQVAVDGKITSLQYEEARPAKGFFGRLFG